MTYNRYWLSDALADATDRTRMLLTLAFALLVSLTVALVLSAVTLAADVHHCHDTGGTYSWDGSTGTCSWAPEAGPL